MVSRRRERFHFENDRGERLAGLLEWPEDKPRAFALFAHCFTCSKNARAATYISRALNQSGFAVLRFDFTGLGNSEGDFANTNFSTNVSDLVVAADYLRRQHQAPSLLIGHSLGGAAVLAAASEVAEVRAVITLGAPSDPAHVTHLFKDRQEEILDQGEADVALGGRSFTIKRQFIEDVNETRLRHRIRNLGRPLLILHSPQDDIVSVDEAGKIYRHAQHPKSFISMDGVDHLLTREADGRWVAGLIANWAERYLDSPTETPVATDAVPDGWVRVRSTGSGYTQEVATKDHRLIADEPLHLGGNHLGPNPYEYLLGALGSCTAITIQMVARRKQWPLERVSVLLNHKRVHAKDCETCESERGKVDIIERRLSLEGPLDEAQRTKLLAIADKCPVHRTLHGEIKVITELDEAT